jgi:formylmethanofuran dehydrogenase subunit E
MRSFEVLLRESVEKHGHLCPGQVIGVRMAVLGCRLIGLDEPSSKTQRKKLMVFVEIDRCATDAIESVTGCKLGKRNLKLENYGIMAATFLNLETSLAYRIVAREEARGLAALYAPEVTDPHQQQLAAYMSMSDQELFQVQRVEVSVPPWEMPGPTMRKARCSICGQVVRDGKEVLRGDQVLCRPCNGDVYFRHLGALRPSTEGEYLRIDRAFVSHLISGLRA